MLCPECQGMLDRTDEVELTCRECHAVWIDSRDGLVLDDEATYEERAYAHEEV